MTKIILDRDVARAQRFIDSQGDPDNWVSISSARATVGLRFTEARVTRAFYDRPDWFEIAKIVQLSAMKTEAPILPVLSENFEPNFFEQRLMAEAGRRATMARLAELGELAKQRRIEPDDEVMTESEHASEMAWDYLQAAFDPGSPLYRDHGPDRLIAAGQAYAMLARG